MPRNLVFVDTSGWFASLVPSDSDHVAAQSWLRANRRAVFTTDFVLDETLTLLRARGQSNRALAFGHALLDGSLAQLYFLAEDDIREAWTLFSTYGDKQWSFTDCTSFAIMSRLSIPTALAFDHHFGQIGTVIVVPGLPL